MLKWRSVKTQAGLPVTVEEISTVVRWTLYVPELKQTEQRGTRHFKIMSFKDISSEAFLFFSPLLLIFIVFNYNLIVATQDLSRDPNKYFPEVSSSWSFHCLYILYTRFPIRYMIAMIFSHHRGCLFTFLIMAFDMQIFLILIKSTLLFFFLLSQCSYNLMNRSHTVPSAQCIKIFQKWSLKMESAWTFQEGMASNTDISLAIQNLRSWLRWKVFVILLWANLS